MRDPARIDDVLHAVRRHWLRVPDMRLGQLLIAAVAPESPCPELFYIEEKDLLKKLEDFADQR